MQFNISTTGINVTLDDLGLTLTHPETVNLLEEVGYSDIIDSQELVAAISSGILVARDEESNIIGEIEYGKIVNDKFSGDYNDLINQPDLFTPNLSIDVQVIENKRTSTTFQLVFTGGFLDTASSVIVSGIDNNIGVTSSIISSTFSQLIIEVTVNTVEQNYNVVINGMNNSVSTGFTVEDLTGTGSAGTTITDFNGGDISPFSQVGTVNWSFSGGGTPSTGTGAASPPSGFSVYAFTETSNPVVTSDTFILQTNDFAKITQISFKYHMFGEAMGTFKLQYSDDGGSNWQDKEVLVGQQQTAQGNSWLEIVSDFMTTSCNFIRLHFTGRTDFTSDCCITDVNIISV